MRRPERWISFGLFRAGDCVAEGTVRGSGAVDFDPPVEADILAVAGAPADTAVEVQLVRAGVPVALHVLRDETVAELEPGAGIDRVVVALELPAA